MSDCIDKTRNCSRVDVQLWSHIRLTSTELMQMHMQLYNIIKCMALVTLHCQIVLQRRMHIWHTFCTCGERKCKNTFSLSSNASLLAARTNRQEAEGDSGLAKWVKLVRSGETRKYGAVVRQPATRSTTSAAAAASADLEEHRYTAFDSQSWSKIDPWVAGMCMSNRIWGRTEVGFRGPARSVARFPIISVRHYFRSRHSFFCVCDLRIG